MFDLIEQLTGCYGPSGREAAVADTIEKLLKGHVDSMRRDAMGNLICVRKGTAKDGKKILFSAHMDQIGFIVAAIEKEGFLRVAPVGGISTDFSFARHVYFPNGTQGALMQQSLKAGEKNDLKFFYIDVGAKDAAEAEKLVSVGDVAVVTPDCYRVGKERVVSPALDDRAACALLVRIMLDLPKGKNTVVAVFSTQEEVGCRGAKTAAYAEEPDVAIALDVTPAADVPEGSKQINVGLGAGAAIKIMDRMSISNPEVVDGLFAAAKKGKITVQREVLPYGGTDAGSMQLTRGGVPVCTISIPCRNVHSPVEMIDLSDMEAARRLALEYVK